MVEERFINWLVKEENKKINTAKAYALSINKISEHINKVTSLHTKIYLIKNAELLAKIVDLYQLKGEYAEIGNIGHGTYRNALKAYYRFFTKSPKSKRLVNNKEKKSLQIKTVDNDFNFDEKLIEEAKQMSEYYKLIYCLEKSIRRLVEVTLYEEYGDNWWNEKVIDKIRDKVNSLIENENNRVFSKKSEHKIDYTTFGELRKIVETNWDVFSKKFKNSTDFRVITENLNTLRNSIAHSVVLPDDEISRLNLALKDWFRLLK
ncbi:Swt1 family HEPN domain-containing protein [Litoribaculum gwangyangense]|uniref:Swt1-like HEPN domain-containing protein n=1 Tax=Litoribaculum gwangyangense TaxID=1130722 RepID=A0ABP9C5T0_9FLAO